MPSTDRRRFLQATGAALLGVGAGCTTADRSPGTARPTDTPTRTPTRTPTATGTYGDTVPGPESYPDRPVDLTPETVREYVHDFEYARTYNSLHEPDVTDLSADCRTRYDTAAHGGHYALATCTGYANYPDVHADWGQLPALYFVGPNLTVRVADYEDHYFDCKKVYASSDPTENFAERCSGDDAAYRAYNLHPEPHDLSVTVEFLGEGETNGETEVVLERRYALAPTAGIKQGSVTYRRGTYRVTAALDTGRETSYQWSLQSAQTYRDPPVTILVTPAGGVSIRPVPFHRL